MQWKVLYGLQNMNRKAKVIAQNVWNCATINLVSDWEQAAIPASSLMVSTITSYWRYFSSTTEGKEGGWLFVPSHPPIVAQFCAFQVIASAFPIMFWGLFGIFQNLPEFCFFILGIIRLTSLYIIFQDLKQTCADNEFFPAICLTGPIKPAQS